MTRIKIKTITFDAYNTEHIKKHNVTKEEIYAIKTIIYHEKSI